MTNVVCDIDGVLWTRSSVLPGVVEGLSILAEHNINLYFVTNNSFIAASELEQRIRDLGFDASGRVITSPMVVAASLPKSSKIFALAGKGTVDSLSEMEHILCSYDDNPDYVVVGLRTDFDYQMLTNASTALRAGAQLIATNDDPAFPTESGLLPGGGAILAAVATASEKTPIVFGKPYLPMVSFVQRVFKEEPIHFVIGDRSDHDGEFAAKLSAQFINVISDATKSASEDHKSVVNLLDAARIIVNR